MKTRKPAEGLAPPENETPPEETAEVNELKEQEDSYIRIDNIINNFYASLLPDETNLVQDFPKEDFPHNVNIRIKVVRREEIPAILNPPEEEFIDEEAYDPNYLYHEDSQNMLSGVKRDRYDDNYSPTVRGSTTELKRAKLYE